MACFVHRNGVDTLLVCDGGNSRLVEFAIFGTFLRQIPVVQPSHINSIAYCKIRDVIAVVVQTMRCTVLQLDYESCGNIWPPWSCSVKWGSLSAAYSGCGKYLALSNYTCDDLKTYCTTTGAFVDDIRNVLAAEMLRPIKIQPYGNGWLVVNHLASGGSVAMRGERSVFVEIDDDRHTIVDVDIAIHSISAFDGGVIVLCMDGSVVLFRDQWLHSSKCGWIAALL